MQRIFDDLELRKQLENTHGKAYVKQLIEHLRDVISGSPNRGGGDKRNDVLDQLVNFMAATRLGFNISLLPARLPLFLRLVCMWKCLNL